MVAMDAAHEPSDLEVADDLAFDLGFITGLRAKSSSSCSVMSVWVGLPSRLRSSSAPMKRRCFSDLAGMALSSGSLPVFGQPRPERIAPARNEDRSMLQSSRAAA